MADNLKNVRIMVPGHQLSVSQCGVQLIKEIDESDPVVEVVVITRRKSGVFQTEACLHGKDTLSKMAEHLNLRSNFESAQENARLIYEDEQDE